MIIEPFITVQIGAFGSITTIDEPNFWVVDKVCELGLIVTSCDNPKKWRFVHPENFWILLDNLKL